MDEALRYLQAGEVVGIFPEATISRCFEVKELKSGAARIAAQAGVPLIPVVLWGTQRMMTKDHPRDFSRGKTIGITVGEPLYPTGDDPVAETAELHERMVGAARRGDRELPRRGAAARLLVAARVARRLGADARRRPRGSTPRRRRAGAARRPTKRRRQDEVATAAVARLSASATYAATNRALSTFRRARRRA